MIRRGALLAVFALCGCRSALLPGTPGPVRFRLPPEMQRPAGAPAHTACVVHAAQGGLTWEIHLPDSESTYELRAPVAASAIRPAGAALDAPDGGFSDYDAAYLAGLARAANHFSARRFEPALAEVDRLARTYPKDSRAWAMKGSLLVKLGRRDLARKAWERALQLEPDNAAVTEALRRLEEEEE